MNFDAASKSLRTSLESIQKDVLESFSWEPDKRNEALSATFITNFTAYPTFGETPLDPSPLDALKHNISEFLKSNPTHEFKIHNQSSLVSPKYDAATTFVTFTLHGLACGSTTVVREAVTVFYWRYTKALGWKVYHFACLSGPGAHFV